MKQGETYKKIEEVLIDAGRPLAPHEFVEVSMVYNQVDGQREIGNGRTYVGITESTLGRRLREMVGLKRVTVQRRSGKAFVEYSPAPKPEAVPA